MHKVIKKKVLMDVVQPWNFLLLSMCIFLFLLGDYIFSTYTWNKSELKKKSKINLF